MSTSRVDPGAGRRPLCNNRRFCRGTPSSGNDCTSASAGSAKPASDNFAPVTSRASTSATPGISANRANIVCGTRFACTQTSEKRVSR